MMEPFLSAVPLIKKLEAAGYEAYFVGGSVRDYLLGNPIHDVDIATSATPSEVKSVFSKTVDIGIEHGTVLVLFQNESYEVTTFRTESEYLDNRHPKAVSFIRNIREDLQRRDFTMNAIAMDSNGELIDPFSGREAIKRKIIQTVGEADERFHEDALRMMRAVRFVSQLSFEIENKTLKSLEKLTPLLENIAIERKRAEFEKLLTGRNKKNAIRLIINTGLFPFLPGLEKQKNGLEKMLSFELERLTGNEMWSLLLFCIELEEDQIEAFLRDWRLPLKELREYKLQLFYLHNRLNHDWTLQELYMAKRNHILSVEKLYQVITGLKKNEAITEILSKYEKLPIKDRSELDVTGNDIMGWLDKKGGPWIKETLFHIEDAILHGKLVNEKRKIKEWLMECNQS